MRRYFPEKVRVSTGSAIVLGLMKGRLDAKPTTTYLLTYRPDRCSANCGFCPQAKKSEGRADMLSRVTWPPFPTELVLSMVEQAFKNGATRRVCLQTLNYPTVFDDVLSLVEDFGSRVKVPLSISCQPLGMEQMTKLAELGVDRISVSLDAATKELFDRVKGLSAGGPYVWERQRETLEEAVQIFGKGRVTTHLIAGLGENEREIIETVQWCVDSGIYPSLFAFTPIPGTSLEDYPQPSISYYRRVQIARHLVFHGKTRYENMVFSEDGRIADFGVSKERMRAIIRTGSPFITSGCPSCNRPYYNEKPSGPIYNYPRRPLPEEMIEIKKQIDFM